MIRQCRGIQIGRRGQTLSEIVILLLQSGDMILMYGVLGVIEYLNEAGGFWEDGSNGGEVMVPFEERLIMP